jgi:hypothetical protein
MMRERNQYKLILSALTVGSITGASFLLILTALGGSIVGCSFVQSQLALPDPDDDVRKIFWSHETEFQKLASMMMDEQKVKSLNEKWGWYSDSKGHDVRIDWDLAPAKDVAQARITPERLKLYQQLMSVTGVTELWSDSAEGSIHMRIGSITDQHKHICYSPHGRPQNYRLVSNTELSTGSDVCTLITTDWYFVRDIVNHQSF